MHTTARTTTLLLTVMCLTAALITQTARAQTTTPDTGTDPVALQVPPNYPLPPEAAPMFASIMVRLQDLRELEYTNIDIPLRVIPVEKFEQRLRTAVDAIYPPDRHDDIVAGLARLGMINPNTDLAAQTVTARLGQSAIVYNTRSDRMLLIMEQIPYEYLTSNAPWVLARVLQDQHHDINAILSTIDALQIAQPRQDDQALAIRFVLDGEPTYLQFNSNVLEAGDADPMTEQTEDETLKTLSTVAGVQITLMTRPTLRRYAEQIDKGRDEPILSAMFAMGDSAAYVINPIYVALNKGAYLISFLKRVGGWEDVQRAYRELPASTEQTLHPEKLFYEPDLPTTITLPQFNALTRAKWTPVDSAVHGEYHLFNLFRRWQFDLFQARLATSGWDGDIYQAWKSRAETYAVICATTWDTEKDAEEFYKGYLRLLGTKYLQAKADADFTTSRYSYACGIPALEHGWLILRGREVFIIEGLPKDLGTEVLAELEAMKIEYVQ